jgi:hypothetical protein
MKIAIPTNDGEHVTSYLRTPRGFMIATVNDASEPVYEMRWNLLSEILTSGWDGMYRLGDCDAVMTIDIQERYSIRLIAADKKVISTSQSTIEDAINEYLEGKRIPARELQ